MNFKSKVFQKTEDLNFSKLKNCMKKVLDLKVTKVGVKISGLLPKLVKKKLKSTDKYKCFTM
jgi:hypothetical protein